ncbi:hypothetical protein VF14_27870 [Nostoc linckia z18]|uniref:DUF4351 domain-containing protein n=2 Tax=Nostoc linckia TaxID=92942 RepID=A0A9Q5Z5B3_NOSLI|nr:DUF4351 domain-containing protein [Nostoc linckia]PHK37942.1 hypothetical protein VF12_19290 [Nostoc linckia z15]PHK42718.1 hypothetical protein VF13_29075 [Nostoc linckia z16]PHJ57874.1 hypothetical protein VF02_29240 [Nostoc linckia z1]PHJ60524.1 hypothetical protein VF05_30450 [Nostoc linckia z3]PHJ62123.1 hypothetical protein VF03_31635 [Nostoc linckia z2]
MSYDNTCKYLAENYPGDFARWLLSIDTKDIQNTTHRYRVIRLWEEDPTPLLANPALLPLATLAKADSPRDLLTQVAAAVDMIEETDQRQNISACVQVLAGLRFEKNLIQQLFTEEIMQESVIYQDILQKGEERGKKQEALQLILRLLTRRFTAIGSEIEQQIRTLSITQLEDLAEALLDFNSQNDLVNYLQNISLPQANQQE